jgi:hypothetical protein
VKEGESDLRICPFICQRLCFPSQCFEARLNNAINWIYLISVLSIVPQTIKRRLSFLYDMSAGFKCDFY